MKLASQPRQDMSSVLFGVDKESLDAGIAVSQGELVQSTAGTAIVTIAAQG